MSFDAIMEKRADNLTEKVKQTQRMVKQAEVEEKIYRSSKFMKLYRAEHAWSLLKGVVCLYKPPGLSLESVFQRLRSVLCKDLNSLEVRPPRLIKLSVPATIDDNSLALNVKGETTVITELDYSDHPLVVGDRYLPEDIQLQSLRKMDDDTSGVCGHVTPYYFEKALSRLQSHFQKAAFDYMGVDIQSQEAYELASRGLVRPKEDSRALFYGLKLIKLNRPYFTLEVQAANEVDWFLKNFVHELGLVLRTTACYRKVRRVRLGHFTLDHALLEKHWTLKHILSSIAFCNRLVEKPKLNPPQLLGCTQVDPMSANASKYIESIPSDLEADDFGSNLLSDDDFPLLDDSEKQLLMESSLDGDLEPDDQELCDLNEEHMLPLENSEES